MLLISPRHNCGVFTPASAGRFEFALMPEPQRQPDTDPGQNEKDHPPVGRDEADDQQDTE